MATCEPGKFHIGRLCDLFSEETSPPSPPSSCSMLPSGLHIDRQTGHQGAGRGQGCEGWTATSSPSLAQQACPASSSNQKCASLFTRLVVVHESPVRHHANLCLQGQNVIPDVLQGGLYLDQTFPRLILGRSSRGGPNHS